MSIISGKEYRTPTLDIYQEFALASKISPVLAMMSLSEDKSKLEARFPQAFTSLVQNMTREDKDEIIKTSLTGVHRKDGDTWAPVMVSGRIMYRDIDIRVAMKLLWEIIVAHKLIDFFAIDPSTSTEQPGESPASSGSGTSSAG